MLKKSLLSICFILFWSNVFSQETSARQVLIIDDALSEVSVNYSNLKVNNVPVTSVDFNGDSNVNFDLQVDLETFNGDLDNIFGNLFLYYKPSNELSEIQIGFTAVTFTVTYPPFVSQTTYNSVNYFYNIGLNSSDFYASGGKIYAKYINNNGNVFVSANISVVGGTKPPVSNNAQNNVICCTQFVRRGDKPQEIVGSDAVSFYNSWGITSSPQVEWVDTNLNSLSNVAYSSMNVLKFDYIFDNKTVKREFYAPWIAIPDNMAPNKLLSNQIDLVIVNNPILNNFIYTQLADNNGVFEYVNGSLLDCDATTSFVNPIIVDNPTYESQYGDNLVEATEFQWQFSSHTQGNIWSDIIGETNSSLESFLPPSSPFNQFRIRRIVKYNGISLVSNILNFNVIDSNTASNEICCSQTFTTLVNTPNLLEGNEVFFNINDATNFNPSTMTLVSSNISYQWQYKDRANWVDLPSQTQNCLPSIYPTRMGTYYYRRIATVNCQVFNNANPSYIYTINYVLYSNEVSITNPGRTNRMSIIDSKNNIDSVDEDGDLGNNLIYPNPATDNFNVLVGNDFLNGEIFLRDNNGRILQKENIKNIKININISNLVNGIYFVEIVKDGKKDVKKILIN